MMRRGKKGKSCSFVIGNICSMFGYCRIVLKIVLLIWYMILETYKVCSG
jgi:hypothetical protein